MAEDKQINFLTLNTLLLSTSMLSAITLDGTMLKVCDR